MEISLSAIPERDGVPVGGGIRMSILEALRLDPWTFGLFQITINGIDLFTVDLRFASSDSRDSARWWFNWHIAHRWEIVSLPVDICVLLAAKKGYEIRRDSGKLSGASLRERSGLLERAFFETDARHNLNAYQWEFLSEMWPNVSKLKGN